MILVLTMAAVLWGIGMAMGAPKRQRWVLIGVLMLAVLTIQLTLPAGHPLREATGGDVRLWLLLIGFAALFMGYFRLVRGLRARAAQPVAAPTPDSAAPLSEVELTRYARHIMLREIGGPGQVALKRAKVLVVGAGGLGAPALQYLAAAGVGTLGVIDDDAVDASNLQRQVIHGSEDIGTPKVQSATDKLAALNPHIALRPYHRRLTPEIAGDLIADYDLVLDGSDNFQTRYLVNETCVRLGKPLIAAALTQWEGQISLYDPARGTPCYACIFPEAPDPALVPSCAEAGVLGPLPGVVGSMMAVEAVKHLTGAGRTLAGRLMLYDALDGEVRSIAITPRPGCPVCGATEV